jgi:hypothetical protein
MQALVYVVMQSGGGLLLLRGILSLIGSGVLFCAYFFASRLFSPAAGLIALTLLGSNLMFAALTTVPYSEILFIGLVFLTLAFSVNSHNPDSLRRIPAVNLACLTRYEGWLLAGLLVIEEGARYLKHKPIADLAPSIYRIALLVLAPAGWLVFVVSEPGGLFGRLESILNFTTGLPVTSLFDRFISRLNGGYIVEFAGNFIHLLRWQASLGILLFGLFGWIRTFMSSLHRYLHVRILVFLILDLLLIAFWGPWDFSTLRQVFLWEVFIVLYAAHGIEQSIQLLLNTYVSTSGRTNGAFSNRWILTGMLVFLIVLYLPPAVRFVSSTSQEPEYSIPAKFGSWLGGRLNEDDAILALTDDPFQINALATYISLSPDAILDDRLDVQYVHSRLDAAQQVYVVPLYEHRDGLSSSEARLLEQLELQQIPASGVTVAGRELWICSGENVSEFLRMIELE